MRIYQDNGCAWVSANAIEPERDDMEGSDVIGTPVDREAIHAAQKHWERRMAFWHRNSKQCRQGTV